MLTGIRDVVPTVLGRDMDAIGKGLNQTGTGCSHPESRAVGTECGGVHARASKTGINVSGYSYPYSGQAVVHQKWVSVGHLKAVTDDMHNRIKKIAE